MKLPKIVTKVKGFDPIFQKNIIVPVGVTWDTNNKYKPHQGKKEASRRKSQIAAGALKVS